MLNLFGLFSGFTRQAPMRLDALIVPPGSTLVIKRRHTTRPELKAQLQQALDGFKEKNPGTRIVMLYESEWETFVTGEL